jgi:hypothetical protein
MMLMTEDVVVLSLTVVQYVDESCRVMESDGAYPKMNKILLPMIFGMVASNMSSLIDLKSTMY